MDYLKKRLHELYMLSGVFTKILCHGQYFCIYPAAYDSEEERRADIDPVLTRLGSDIEVDVRTSDGVVLKCYLLRQTKLHTARATIILFHGNGYHSWCYTTCGYTLRELGFNALMVSYRGYGASEGKPSERGLRRDAQAALDYVLADPQLSSVPVVLHGHSLGGAVAIDLASRNPNKIHAIMVENTFLSIPQVAKTIPIVRHFTFLIHQRWNSAAKLPLIPRSTPILFLSGRLDQVAPEAHMLGLRDIAAGRDPESKAELQDVFHSFPYGGHADTGIQPGYFKTIDRFLQGITVREV
ncbi:Alpha/Beta hydrolase protein [Mucidula mucida]|nr:Alpha/Beta hydrolase protein [Mucidula mucida]KAF8890242.1 Alpha/Beta hydrolase protein [Mucidula mucida]